MIFLNIFIIHAFTGSDTTSEIFSIGKSKALNKLIHNHELQSIAKIFNADERSNLEIEIAGNRAILILFGRKTFQSINELRHRMLIEKVAHAKTFVAPKRSSPTESSSKYHSYRTYYQISIWRNT
jgi:dihydrofolate reductase